MLSLNLLKKATHTTQKIFTTYLNNRFQKFSLVSLEGFSFCLLIFVSESLLSSLESFSRLCVVLLLIFCSDFWFSSNFWLDKFNCCCWSNNFWNLFICWSFSSSWRLSILTNWSLLDVFLSCLSLFVLLA